MKKIILVVVLMFVGFSCFAFNETLKVRKSYLMDDLTISFETTEKNIFVSVYSTDKNIYYQAIDNKNERLIQEYKNMYKELISFDDSYDVIARMLKNCVVLGISNEKDLAGHEYFLMQILAWIPLLDTL